MFVLGTLVALITAAGVVRTAHTIRTDGYGRVPTRTA
jgi:hypothetical protein